MAALNRKRFNNDTRLRFISFAPTEPRKNRIRKEEIPNHRFISKSARKAPRTPVQLSTDPRLITRSDNGIFSILLWSAPPVKKNEINARPTYMVTMEITNPVIKRVRSLVKKFRIPLNLLSPLFVFCFAVVFLAITQLNLQHANVHRKFQVPYDIRISLRLQSQNSGKTFGCGILY